MQSDLITIKEACEELKTSRATLYKLLDKNGITTIKQGGNKSYITKEALQKLKNPQEEGETEEESPQIQVPAPVYQTVDIEFFKEQIRRLEEKNDRLQAKNEQLATENGDLKQVAGRWQGMAEAYQQQVLRLQNEEKLVLAMEDKKNTEEEQKENNGIVGFFRNIFK